MYLRQAMLVMTTQVDKDGKPTIINQRHHNGMPHPMATTYDSIEAALLDMWQPCSTDMITDGYVTTFKRAAE